MDAMSIIGADCKAHMRAFIRLYLILFAVAILLFCVAIANERVSIDGWEISILILNGLVDDNDGIGYGTHLIYFHGPIPLVTGILLLLVGIFAGIGSLSYRLVRPRKRFS